MPARYAVIYARRDRARVLQQPPMGQPKGLCNAVSVICELDSYSQLVQADVEINLTSQEQCGKASGRGISCIGGSPQDMMPWYGFLQHRHRSPVPYTNADRLAEPGRGSRYLPVLPPKRNYTCTHSTNDLSLAKPSFVFPSLLRTDRRHNIEKLHQFSVPDLHLQSRSECVSATHEFRHHSK